MAICDAVFCDHVTDGSLSRITSLSTRLPFEDDTFDIVHVSHISKGVPEHKVKSLRSLLLSHQLMYHFSVELPLRGAFLDPKKFTTYLRWLQEIRRVMQPDGFVEVIEEGAKS
jgi:hypothetical protein